MIARCPPPTIRSLAQGVMGGDLANSLSGGERVNGGNDCTLPTPSLILEQLCNWFLWQFYGNPIARIYSHLLWPTTSATRSLRFEFDGAPNVPNVQPDILRWEALETLWKLLDDSFLLSGNQLFPAASQAYFGLLLRSFPRNEQAWKCESNVLVQNRSPNWTYSTTSLQKWRSIGHRASSNVFTFMSLMPRAFVRWTVFKLASCEPCQWKVCITRNSVLQEIQTLKTRGVLDEELLMFRKWFEVTEFCS